MASRQALKPWQSLIDTLKFLQHVVTKQLGPVHTQEETKDLQVLLDSVQMFTTQAQELPPLPKAVWQTLVHTMKVPQTVTEICCSLLGKVDSIGMAMIDVLASFLAAATHSRVLAQPGAPSELAVAIEQQLQAAGLYTHLGDLFKQFTKQLQATHPTVKVLVELRDLQDSTNEEGSKGRQAVLSAMQNVQQSMLLYTHLQSLWPLTSTPDAWPPSIDAAAMVLALQTAASISQWVDQLPDGVTGDQQEPFDAFPAILHETITAVTRCAMRRVADASGPFHGPAAPPRYGGLLQLPEYVQALCAALVYSTHAHIMCLQGQGSSAGSKVRSSGSKKARSGGSGSSKTGSSGGGGSSSAANSKSSAQKGSKKGSKGSSSSKGTSSAAASSQQQQQGNAWVRACQTAATLPPSQQQLLRALGCSGRAFLWTAITATEGGEDTPTINVWALANAYEQIIDSEAYRFGGPGRMVLRPPAVQQQIEPMHQLLPGVLLHWAASLPRLDDDGVSCCVCALSGSKSALQGVTQLQDQQMHGVVLSESIFGAPTPVRLEWGQYPFRIMEEAVPQLELVMSRLLLEARRSSASIRSSSSRSSSGSSCDGGGMIGSALAHAASQFCIFGDPLHLTEVPVVLSWRADAAGDAAAAAAAAGSSSSPGGAAGDSSSSSAQHPWQQHAAQICAMLESYTRLSTVKMSDGVRHLPFAVLGALCSVGDRAQPNCLAATAAVAGFGSAAQQQLLGLLASIVKRGGTLGAFEQTDGEECRLSAATAAAAFAQLYTAQAVAGSSSSTKVSTGGSSGGSGGSSGAGAQVTALLPWLVLFGRCCLQWAVQLTWRWKGMEGLPNADSAPQDEVSPGSVMGRLGIEHTGDVFLQVQQQGSSSTVESTAADGAGTAAGSAGSGSTAAGAGAGVPLFCQLVCALQKPLEDVGIAAQLSAAAGVDAGMLLQKATTAITAVQAMAGAKGRGAAEGQATSTQQQQHQRGLLVDQVIGAVHHLGAALTALPIGCACNNPYCAKLDGPSEAKLVKGPSHGCSACRAARYCSVECQKKHWKQHKPVCKALAVAVLAATTELVPMENLDVVV